jgi:tricarballylate dehydrogenase
VREFNAACRTDVPFNPDILDGFPTHGFAIDKTDWANPLDSAFPRLSRDHRRHLHIRCS